MKSSSNRESSNISELIILVKKGDRKALDSLLEIYIPQLRAFFKYIHVPQDNIDDLIQETFEKMLNKIDSYDVEKNFSSWLMTIGKNIYVDQYRRKIKGDEILNEFYETGVGVTDPESNAVAKVSLEELLKNLNDKEKFLIEMRIFQNMSFGEISEITDEKESTLRSRFFRIINNLKNII